MAYFPYYGYVPEFIDLPNYRVDFKIGSESLFVNLRAPDTNSALAIARATIPPYAFIDNIERKD